ncbi:hypothetical protein [Agrococcus carbonis]|uniref:Uncharacterized protein n=1 Tax=Agrococcus carbonis TaxID=684552 RepID=A0A1H1QAK4_9MICO|nr:hypothetical protein [Agrococcus carbonis]SDS20522.1 hypothetical protein SAMN04489719_1784 [Agrococcus carbonis]
MDTNSTWLIAIGIIAIVAAASAVVTALRGRAPRTPIDAERLARLRDAVADREARAEAARLDARVAADRHARTRAPQRERVAQLWAGGV